MAELFFHLRGVPEDEAEDVRSLLLELDIPFYETTTGFLGLSTPALWLYSREDAERAWPAFSAYQQRRAEEQRRLYLAQHKPRGWQSWLRLAGFLWAIVFVAYWSVKWLFDLGFSWP